MAKLFTCKACECSYSLRQGEEYPTECDRCKEPVVTTKTVIEEAAKLKSLNDYEKEFRVPLTIPQPFTKHDQDKLAWNLLPMETLEGVVRVLMHGAKKYEPFNWQKGAAYSRYYNAAMRHLVAFSRGENEDQDSGLHHLDHALCCLMFLRYYELHPDDYSPHDNRLEGRLNERKDIEVQGSSDKKGPVPALQEAV